MFEEELQKIETENKPVEEKYTQYKSIEDLFSEMNEDRESVSEQTNNEVQDDEFEEIPETDVFEEKEIEKPKIEPGLKAKIARHEARFLTKTNDSLNAFICSIIADDDIDNYTLEKSDLKEFEDIIFDYRKDANSHLPVWLQIAGYIAAAYGPLYKKAFDTRKLNKRNAKLEAENKEQQKVLQEQNLKIIEFINSQKEKENETQKNENEKDKAN